MKATCRDTCSRKVTGQCVNTSATYANCFLATLFGGLDEIKRRIPCNQRKR